MTVEEGVRARLLMLSTLTALVSTRVYLDKLPQSPTYPCVRVSLVDELGDYHLRGGGLSRRARVQVDVFAREVSGVDPYALAMTVADVIHGDDNGSGLSGWAGVIGGSPQDLVIYGAFRIDRRRSYDPDELRVLTMSQDYQVAFRA